MFGALFRQAQATVDDAVSRVVNRLVIVVPLVVALGFATAALSGWLSREIGPELAHLYIAGGYAAISAVAAISVSRRYGADVASGGVADANPGVEAQSKPSDVENAGKAVDRDLLVSFLSSAAPVALPLVARVVLRNLPLLLLLLAAVFLIGKTSSADGDNTEEVAVPEPAE